MTVSDTIAAVARVIDLLAENPHPEAYLVAAALERWRVGESLEDAFGLPTDWRERERIGRRDRSLREFLRLNPDTNASTIARRILAELPACARLKIRPDGAAGHIHDLAGLGLDLSERHLRRLVADLRGHQEACNGHDVPTGSATRRK